MVRALRRNIELVAPDQDVHHDILTADPDDKC
jgi:hypothetical protein